MRTAAVAAFTFALLHGTAHAHPGRWGAVRGNMDRPVEPLRGDVARQHQRAVEVPERVRAGGVRIVVGRHVDGLERDHLAMLRRGDALLQLGQVPPPESLRAFVALLDAYGRFCALADEGRRAPRGEGVRTALRDAVWAVRRQARAVEQALAAEGRGP